MFFLRNKKNPIFLLFFSRITKATLECTYTLIYVFLNIIVRADLEFIDNMIKPLCSMHCTVCTVPDTRCALQLQFLLFQFTYAITINIRKTWRKMYTFSNNLSDFCFFFIYLFHTPLTFHILAEYFYSPLNTGHSGKYFGYKNQ